MQFVDSAILLYFAVCLYGYMADASMRHVIIVVRHPRGIRVRRGALERMTVL